MTEGLKRRDFLKVLGVTSAGATLTGCSTEGVERYIPYVTAPDQIVPGIATWYTSVCNGCSAQCGMWVRNREGKVVKVEGNERHPVSGGALCSRGHATLQHLYNPDRFSGPMARQDGTLQAITWEEAEQMLAERIQAAGGNVHLIHGHMGPTLTGLVDAFLQGVGGARTEYQALSEAPLREAMRIAFGVDELPHYDFEAADFVLSLGDDFLETGASPVAYGRGFARFSGEEDGEKGRFAFAGPRLSLTGLNADDWLPIRPGSEAALALGMASVVADSSAAAGPYASLLESYDAESAAEATGIDADTIREMAQRFAAGPSLALGPGVAAHHRNATAAHLAVLVLNQVAGNVGETLHLSGGPSSASAPYAGMEAAIRAMAGGQVGVAMVHGANPAYELPDASGFNDAFSGVGFKVSFASAPDETTALADLVLPDRHFLEAWGDSAPRFGVMAIQQPAMQPVPYFDSRATADVLLSVGRQLGTDLGAESFYDYLRAAHQERTGLSGADFELAWQASLRDGVIETGDAQDAAPAELQAPDAALTFDAPELDGDGDLTLVVYPSSRFGAGEFANSPWQQELPDPVSKIMWHSWVEMNPATAEARGLREGDMVSVASPHGEVEVPVWLYPGIREDTVALSMGTGHTNFGRFATDQGVNAITLLPAVAEQPSGAFVTLATTVTVAPTGQGRRLATTEGSADQRDRPIAPAVQFAALGAAAEEGEGYGEEGGGYDELQELQGVGGFVPVDAEGGDPQAYPLEGARYGNYEDAHEGPRWSMAIDLDKCTGCSACVTACSAENNVPWVGEDQVQMGRDMHWMRIERYYEHLDASHASHVDVRFLPMMCQHCGNAPCEPVCPVYATYHTPDGINSQVYNRCVGTRYCANNCPYKVRVFNWYRYTDDVPEPMHWQWNPDVTVRANGVMEKCSFCMQRVRNAQHRVAIENRDSVRDGEIQTACQQSCPAEAIVFGDIRDPDSRVAQLYENERTYRVLDDLLNTQPAVSYLKKVTFHEVSGGH